MSLGSAWDRAWRAVSGVAKAAGDVALFVQDAITLDATEVEQFQDNMSEMSTTDALAAQVLSDAQPTFEDAAANAFGPDSGVGAAVGGLPQGARDFARERFIEPAERFERNVTRGVASTVLRDQTAPATLSALPSMEAIGTEPEMSWEQAWELSDEVTTGQAVLLGINGADPLDPAARERVASTPAGSLASGTLDALVQWYAPGPGELAAGAAVGARISRARRLIPDATGGAKAIERFFNEDRSWVTQGVGNGLARIYGSGSDVGQRIRVRAMESGFGRWENFIDEQARAIDSDLTDQFDGQIDEVLTEQQQLAKRIDEPREPLAVRDDGPWDLSGVEDRYLQLEARGTRLEADRNLIARNRLADRLHQELGYDNVHNGHLAAALAHADDANQRALVWRVFTGDPGAVGKLRQQSEGLFSQIEDYKIRVSTEMNDGPSGWLTQQKMANSDGLLKARRVERDRLIKEHERLVAMENFQGVRSGDALTSPGVTKVLRQDIGEKVVGIDAVSGRVKRLMEKMPNHWWDTNNTLFLDRSRHWLRDSGMDEARVESISGQLAGANDAGVRWRVLADAEDEIVRLIANEQGLSEVKAQAILGVAADARRANRNLYRNTAKYGVMRTPDGDEVFITSPITQQQMADVFTPIDVEDARRQIRRFREWADENPETSAEFDDIVSRITPEDQDVGEVASSLFGPDSANEDVARFGLNPLEETNFEMVGEAVNSTFSLWKAGKVARPAYLARAMLLDEGFRMAAHFGGLSALAQIAKGGPRIVGRFADDPKLAGKAAVVAGGLAAMSGAGWIPGAAVAAGAWGVGRIVNRGDWAQRLSKLGNDLDAFGDTADARNAMGKKVLANTEADLVREGSSLARRSLDDEIRPTGRFRMVQPSEGRYDDDWVRVVNRQFREDEAFRMSLDGADANELAAWMESPDGVRWRSKVDPSLSRDPRQWAREIASERDALFDGDADLMAAAARRKVTRHDVPEMERRHAIHGETFREVGKPGALTRMARAAIDPLVEIMAELPSEELMRSPFYQMRYRELIAARVKAARRAGDGISERQAGAFRQQARNQALADMERAMYSYADRSRFASLFRFVDPFFSPFENAVKAWYGIAKKNPMYPARLGSAYLDAVENTIETRDEDGNEYKLISIPEGLHDAITKIPWLSALPEDVTFSADFSSLNVILQTPSIGPASAALKPVVRRNPELEDHPVVSYIFPFGVQEPTITGTDVGDELIPTVIARIYENRATSDRMQATRVQILQNHLSKMKQGQEPFIHPDDEEWDELILQVEREAEAVTELDMIARNWSPAFTKVNTWAEPYIRAYRAMAEEDPRTAQDRFMAEYGDEFLPVVNSVYQTNLSLPATEEAFDALADPNSTTGAKLAEVAHDDPALARMVVGTVGAGSSGDGGIQFWQRFKNMETYPGSGEPVVEVQQSLVDAFEDPETSEGWRVFLAYMDEVDAKMEELGLSSLRESAAEELAAEVELTRDQIATEYPSWWAEYNDPGRRDQWDVRQGHLRDLATSEPWSQREGMAELRTYLQFRDEVSGLLATREHSTLAAQSNEEIRAVWDEFVRGLVDSNLTFAETYHYLLENSDPFNDEVDLEDEPEEDDDGDS